MSEHLILVDENDRPKGKMEKLLVHQQGLLHRAFSIFIFNSNGELLLQQRADEKYHSGGLWTNTCCSHPRFEEDITDTINRRLYEEMGMKCAVSFGFSFIYKVTFENNLTEHEYDHVYFGFSNDIPKPEPSEVKNWKYLSLETLETDMQTHSDRYTEWLKICFPEVKKRSTRFLKENLT